MSSTPKCLQLPRHRGEKLQDGTLATVERLAKQHYLIWIKGTPVTEVQCIPEGSGRWYWRGGLALNWANTRAEAIMNGRARRLKGKRIDGTPLPPWSDSARTSIAENESKKGGAA